MFNWNKIIYCLDFNNERKSIKVDTNNSFNISIISKINENDKYNIHNINFKLKNFKKIKSKNMKIIIDILQLIIIIK